VCYIKAPIAEPIIIKQVSINKQVKLKLDDREIAKTTNTLISIDLIFGFD
jgi:hypothetical protein